MVNLMLMFWYIAFPLKDNIIHGLVLFLWSNHWVVKTKLCKNKNIQHSYQIAALFVKLTNIWIEHWLFNLLLEVVENIQSLKFNYSESLKPLNGPFYPSLNYQVRLYRLLIINLRMQRNILIYQNIWQPRKSLSNW